MSARYRLIVTGEGVELSDCSTQHTVWNVEWNAISRILAWKQDMGIYDNICLTFSRFNRDEVLTCDEDSEGWPHLLDELARRYSLDPGWWSKVAFPAFETNLMVLWNSDLPEGAASEPGRTGGENHNRQEHEFTLIATDDQTGIAVLTCISHGDVGWA
jgi:hypothetical protein